MLAYSPVFKSAQLVSEQAP